MQDHITVHELVDSVVSVLDARDPYTFEHSERVALFSDLISNALKLPKEDVELIHYASHLHDVGKVGIPDQILNKHGTLTAEEFLLMKSHSRIGFNIVQKMGVLIDISPIVLHHHERWDGDGYPDGLKGLDIPLGSRIIALADSFDAMTSNRTYRKRLSVNEAFKEIESYSGTQFCPDVVKAFLSIKKEIKELIDGDRLFIEHNAFNKAEDSLLQRSVFV